MELCTMKIDDFVARDDLQKNPSVYLTLARGASALTEQRLFRSDGSSFYAELAVTRLTDDRNLSIVRDVTARYQAAERAHRAEANFRALLDVFPDAVVVHRAGRVVYANVRAALFMGYESPQTMMGAAVIDAVHPDDRPMVQKRIVTMMRTGMPAGVQRERILRRDGTVFVAEVMALPMRFDDEPAILAVARDVTEREHLQAQLLQSERLASVGVLAAGVAHEINNPLAYTLLNLERVVEGLVAHEVNRESLNGYVGDAIDGARRVQRIVRDLRLFARGVSDEVTAVDVVATMRGALLLVTHELKFRARVTDHLASLPPVRANGDRLMQVFVNLLLNAAQALPESRVESNEVSIDAVVVDDTVRISVRDTGTGIAQVHLARIFDPFFTTKPPGTGTGLGLSICHAIVTSFGGRIDVESRSGEGSTFTVVLPASAEPITTARVTTPPAATPRTTSQGRPRLLLVEDERNMRLVLKGLLTPLYDVTAVDTGREALRRLADENPWDVVLCDLLMPDLTGMDVYDWVCEHRPSLCPCMVFMTGGAYTERAQALLDRCPGRWIEKPFEFDTLLALLARVSPGLSVVPAAIA
jgi:PAS domain S-box-containing protein